MQFLRAFVEQPCCIICVNGCESGQEGLWECSYISNIMDYVNSLMALRTKYFNSPLAKRGFLSDLTLGVENTPGHFDVRSLFFFYNNNDHILQTNN